MRIEHSSRQHCFQSVSAVIKHIQFYLDKIFSGDCPTIHDSRKYLRFGATDRFAGLDYNEYASVARHAAWAALRKALPSPQARWFALTTRGTR